MAGKSKVVQSKELLRVVFMAGLVEMQRAGIEVRVGNTGTSLVVGVEAWRYCTTCGSIVPASEIMPNNKTCRECAAADVPVLAQREASEVPA